jgi:hypothetical protein
MGPTGSPVVIGAIPVDQETAYSPALGYGWLSSSQTGFLDKSGFPKKGEIHHPLHILPPGKDLFCDGFEDARPIVFRADTPNGDYIVTVFLGRYQQRRHDLRVTINNSLAAENIDAWGDVWGSQGGTFIKSVKVPVAVKQGFIQVEVDYEPPQPDSWKEYTDNEPEDGRLWYLGENKSSIVGLRIRSKPDWPAEKRDATSPLQTILVSDAIAGHIDTPDETRIALLKSSLEKLYAIEEKSTAVLERTEVDERILTALQYLRMWGFSWANEKTGLNIYHRYWGAYELCNAVAPDDPLYPLSLLLRMRIAYWNGREGGWKHCYALANRHAIGLKAFYPEHPLVRMYSGESIREPYEKQVVSDHAPRWATLQREALERLRKVIHYWVERRQSENGELGGGWGDDVEILRSWTPLVLATNDKIARWGAKRIADGVYASGEIENGYSKSIGDVEHAAEPVSDTQPLMMAVQYGDPLYFEHCLDSMRCMRDVWTARNNNGDLHFKSHYYSASQTVDTPPRSADVPLNGRAVKPGIWVMWYSGHPAVKELLCEWLMAWVRAARKTENGKPAGILPGSVSFPEGRIGGYAEHWWETKEYDDLTAMGYTATLYHVIFAVWMETRNNELLEPMFAALNAIRTNRATKNTQPQPGSVEWAGQIHDNGAFFDVVEKWRAVSGDSQYDDLLRERASGMMRYHFDGQTDRLKRELESIIEGLSVNVPMLTTEVLFTDRVSIPGGAALTSMITGSFGNPTYYPLHAVTWDGIGDEAAVFVADADSRSLNAQLYAFTETPHTLTMRLWRLKKGEYEIRLTDEKNEETFINQKFQYLERGQSFDLTLPSQRLLKISIQQLRVVEMQEYLADLAIGPADVARVKPGILSVTVHNIGSAPAYPFTLHVTPPVGLTIRKRCRGIEAPLDLTAKSKTFEITYTPPSAKGNFLIELDAEKEIDEISEWNNIFLFHAPKSDEE